MEKKWIALIITLFASTMMAYAQDLTIPGPYKWEKRILLVFSPEDQPDLRKQLDLLERHRAEIEDRDLLIFTIDQASVTHPDGKVYGEEAAAKLREQYNVEANSFTVILIGKDGTEKLRQSEILDTEKLFARIDGMPMRKQEIRKNPGN